VSDQLKQELGCHAVQWKVPHLVQDEQLGTAEGVEPMVQPVLFGIAVQLVEQVDGTLISGTVETCGECHGKGKQYDIGVLHGVENFRYNR